MRTSYITAGMQVGLAVVSQVAAALQLPDVQSSLPDGYSQVPLEWELQSHVGGRTFLMNGTVQDVYKELEKRNPNYRVDFGPEDPVDNGTIAGLHRGSLERHIPSECAGHWQKVNCDIPKLTCQIDEIYEGIGHLKRAIGSLRLPPGPKICAVVSCISYSAILFCSDHDMYSGSIK
jgi:hypothetical protein